MFRPEFCLSQSEKDKRIFDLEKELEYELLAEEHPDEFSKV